MSEKVTVYRFHAWDVGANAWRLSEVWGTQKAIDDTKVGVIDPASAIEIDAGHLDANGMTPRGFNPRSDLLSGGFPDRTDYLP